MNKVNKSCNIPTDEGFKTSYHFRDYGFGHDDKVDITLVLGFEQGQRYYMDS